MKEEAQVFPMRLNLKDSLCPSYHSSFEQQARFHHFHY